MMKYQETVNQSAEYLRLSLPLMSRQAAALHPLSYAIWPWRLACLLLKRAHKAPVR